jgi:hypothetical protein
MAIYCVEVPFRNPYVNYAIFWDSENSNLPDGSANFQRRDYPLGYTPQSITPGTKWIPDHGVYTGVIPLPYEDDLKFVVPSTEQKSSTTTESSEPTATKTTATAKAATAAK